MFGGAKRGKTDPAIAEPQRARASATAATAAPGPTRSTAARPSSTCPSGLPELDDPVERALLGRGELLHHGVEPALEAAAPRRSQVAVTSTCVPKPFSAISTSIRAWSPWLAASHARRASGSRSATSISVAWPSRRAHQALHALGLVEHLPELGRGLDQRAAGGLHAAAFRPAGGPSCPYFGMGDSCRSVPRLAPSRSLVQARDLLGEQLVLAREARDAPTRSSAAAQHEAEGDREQGVGRGARSRPASASSSSRSSPDREHQQHDRGEQPEDRVGLAQAAAAQQLEHEEEEQRRAGDRDDLDAGAERARRRRAARPSAAGCLERLGGPRSRASRRRAAGSGGGGRARRRSPAAPAPCSRRRCSRRSRSCRARAGASSPAPRCISMSCEWTIRIASTSGKSCG